MALLKEDLRPCFLGDSPGKHYVLQFRALDKPRGHIVYIPPFGEEMNRCRALAAAQARAFVGAGYHCTLMDFYGTGDSEGHLRDASLQIWRENVIRTLEFLARDKDLPVTLWGVRLGALIALDVASTLSCDDSAVSIERLLLWQPVTSGKRFVSQLLRQRVASLVNSGQESETTAEIRKRLQTGEAVEISGYLVAENLIADIEQLTLPEFSQGHSPRVMWLENSENPEDELPGSARKAVNSLLERGVNVQVERFASPPIWQLHKRDEAPDLIEKTTRLFA